MSDFFIYGTLLHRPLLNVVAGPDAARIESRPDILPDHAVLPSQDGSYPVLVEAPGQGAEGLVLSNLTDAARARLDFYEIGFDYIPQTRKLGSGASAQVYIPQGEEPDRQSEWDLARWADAWGPLIVESAEEYMLLQGQRAPSEGAWLYPRVQTRAQSRLRAATGPGQGTFQGRVEIERKARKYTEFFALDEYTLRHEGFDGAMVGPVKRAVFLAADAALLLPYDPVRDRILLVEQIRMGPLGRKDPNLWQLEPVAGLIDPGEEPEETARREAGEEAGVELGHVELVSQGYSSPGCTTDYQFMYVGLCDLPDTVAGTGGLAAEGEDIRTHLMDFETALARADAGGFSVQPLVLILHWLARHRARLRSG